MKVENMISKQIYLTLPKHKADLTNKIFGRLTVEKFNYYNRHYFWLCKCTCGEFVSVREDSLLKNSTKSCGCISKEGSTSKRFHDYPTSFNDLFSQYRNNAKVRGLEFTLSREFMYSITKENCFYCGEPPNNIKKTRTGEIYIYSGLDRLSSDIGYIESNIVPCCKICNFSKRQMSTNDFENWIIKVYNYLITKKDVKKHIA